MARVIGRVSTGVAASFDHAVNALALSRRSARSRARSRSESLGPSERERALAALAARYEDPRLFESPDAFFPHPERAAVRQIAVRSFGRAGEVADLTWESGYVPFNPDVAERYLRSDANRTAHARCFVHRDGPRPAVVLIHGYMGGTPGVEERAWPIDWMFRRGLDVVLGVLPFHGPRGPGPFRRPPFPGSDPRMTVEGFRHAIADLRALADWLRCRGSRAVGAMGMSLGGYTTALWATVDPLAFAVPFIPLASVADFAREGGRLVGTPAEQERQHELLEAVYRVVSPLARPVRVPPEGRLVVAGRADRITPMSHAERLAAHFEAPLEVFPGGHLLQLGRARGFRAVGRMLGRLGLLE
ncbi:MAG: alpha/beta hydrolase family protein [Myxococcota bacterium]